MTDFLMPDDECGRWWGGRLGKHCTKAGSEECDWECPFGYVAERSRRSAPKETAPATPDTRGE